ncbi:unnamed protein product [Bursaphelenchus xylophilus]|uniref:(pine wood nematode) hypothetical protein n=1 Tax=Bursaphelenchus xylophilus TaxID=6326 RepID=A0A1I7RUB8_BURXY|nr:unnamed protein product [Bursaphelenchus xylophilus]CAG9114010.1 unnamed protein product [Bursaphelenchus xylophilus]
MAHPTTEWVEFFDPDGEAKYAQDGFVYAFLARVKPRDGYEVGYLYKCEARECNVKIRFDEKEDGCYELQNSWRMRRRLHQHPPDYAGVAAQIAESEARPRTQRGNNEKTTGNFRTDDRNREQKGRRSRNQRKAQTARQSDDNKENNHPNSDSSQDNNNSHGQRNKNPSQSSTKAKRKRRNKKGTNPTTILQPIQQDTPTNSAGNSSTLPKMKSPISRTNGVDRKNPTQSEKGAPSTRKMHKAVVRSAPTTTRPAPPARPASPVRQALARTTAVARPSGILACRPGTSGFTAPRPPSPANSMGRLPLHERPVPSAPCLELWEESPSGRNFFNDQQQILNDEAYARLLASQWASEVATARETQPPNVPPVPQASPVVSQPQTTPTNFLGRVLSFVFKRSAQPLPRADLSHISESECVICFETVRDEVKCQACRQVIGCQVCVQRWMSEGFGAGSCPLCRGAIRNRYL